jgi:recombination protein RecT
MENQATNLADLRQKAKIPAKQAGGTTVANFFEANKKALEIVLPKHIGPDRMLKVALHAIRAVPKLLECTTESLFGAVIQCAQLGLEPNTTLGHAYLVPFRNRKANRTDVQMIVGYKGLLDLARRSGQIVSIAAHAVYENDEFDFSYGLTEVLVHRPAMANRGDILAFYAVAQMQGGGHAYEVMSREQVNAIMASTQSRGQYGPWKDHYEEMGRKTAIRRLSKYLPLSIEFATASTLDQMADSGQEQNLDGVLDGNFFVQDDSAPQIGEISSEPTADNDSHQEQATAGTKAQKPAADKPAWPQLLPDENGEERWADSGGLFYDKEIHGWSSNRPAVKPDGTFRARRGMGARGKAGKLPESHGGADNASQAQNEQESEPATEAQQNPDAQPGDPGPTMGDFE